ncbi:hypothetical protein PM082_016597 [Marasmius tenuissimus]|nr:hypothetical protein PM082_016597 [Marasmius tenuissimus]
MFAFVLSRLNMIHGPNVWDCCRLVWHGNITLLDSTRRAFISSLVNLGSFS